jgi:hypothetical protein
MKKNKLQGKWKSRMIVGVAVVVFASSVMVSNAYITCQLNSSGLACVDTTDACDYGSTVDNNGNIVKKYFYCGFSDGTEGHGTCACVH